MANLDSSLERLAELLAESQSNLIRQLSGAESAEAVSLLERAGKNLKELLDVRNALQESKDVITAEQILEMGFFPEGSMSLVKLYRLAREKKIPSFRLDGRVWFSRKALREFVETSCRNNVVVSIDEKRNARNHSQQIEYASPLRAIPE